MINLKLKLFNDDFITINDSGVNGFLKFKNDLMMILKKSSYAIARENFRKIFQYLDENFACDDLLFENLFTDAEDINKGKIKQLKDSKIWQVFNLENLEVESIVEV